MLTERFDQFFKADDDKVKEAEEVLSPKRFARASGEISRARRKAPCQDPAVACAA
jgi:hypothetical protein